MMLAMVTGGSKQRAFRSLDEEYVDVVHAGETHRVRIRRLVAARRLTLRVRAATRDAILTMPLRGSLAHARTFAERHAAWIGHRLERLPTSTSFGPGALVPFRGELHEIVHRPDVRGTVWLDAEAPTRRPLRLCVGGDAPFVARRVQDFLVRQARLDLTKAVTRHAAALGVQVRRVTLRDTTTRWGSCSSSGALNFSWRLVMAPPFVLDYLAAHEVAHLRHMNHSAQFWATTARLVPDYGRSEGWLKANGAGLMHFGRQQS